jgi:hypothetical protein
MDAAMQGWIQKVREDHVVGRGTCSVIDECWTDEELAAALAAEGVRGWQSVRFWVRRVHRMYLEREREVRAEIF